MGLDFEKDSFQLEMHSCVIPGLKVNSLNCGFADYSYYLANRLSGLPLGPLLSKKLRSLFD